MARRIAEAEADFDAQLEQLQQYSAWLVESRAGLIRRLREELPQRAERGEVINLRAVVKAAAIER
jgi:hypothetical protein